MTKDKAIENIKLLMEIDSYPKDFADALLMAIEALQEVQKHEETFEWCHDCKEYDKDNCCCHRWSKMIRNTVEELKTDRPHGFTADEWYRDTFKGGEE